MCVVFFTFVAVVITIAVIGVLLPNPRVEMKTVQISAPIESVWKRVTDYASQTDWRRDLQKVEVNEVLPQWTEIPNVGSQVTFREREKRAPTRYAIEIIPENGFGGYSTLELEENNEGTKLFITEISEISNPFRRVLSFLFYDPSKRMDLYLEDLRNIVEHN